MADDGKKGADTAAEMSLDDDRGGNITIKSMDGQSFDVPKKYANISNVVKTSLETDADATEINIPGVRGAILAKVVEYMNYHQGKDPGIPDKPLRSKNMKEVCAQHPWDADFIDAIGNQRQLLYDVILAANYMDIKPLLHLGCAKVASLIKGVPLNKIKNILDPNFVDAGDASGAASSDAKPSGDDKKTE